MPKESPELVDVRNDILGGPLSIPEYRKASPALTLYKKHEGYTMFPRFC